MKSPEEFFNENWGEFSGNSGIIYKSGTIGMMGKYALEVAAEQDKITRHAAAELIAENFIRKEADERVWFQTADKVHSEIMNLQTKIKELK